MEIFDKYMVIDINEPFIWFDFYFQMKEYFI